jgi:hypothetical protein
MRDARRHNGGPEGPPLRTTPYSGLRAVGTNAQRDRHQGHECESRASSETTPRVTKILPNGVHGRMHYASFVPRTGIVCAWHAAENLREHTHGAGPSRDSGPASGTRCSAGGHRRWGGHGPPKGGSYD